MEKLQFIMDSEELIKWGGFAIVVLIIFAETGLLVGFFLPGDYFLFLSGVFCGTDVLKIPLYLLVICVTGAAIIGNFTGFMIGSYMGERLFKKEDSRFFKKSYLERTRKFYDRYGSRALILGRFLPVIRTFAPVLAGAVKMNKLKFGLFNVIGATLWVGTLIPLGYFFGVQYPWIIDYATYIIIGFIIITTIPVIRTFRNMGKK